MFNLFKKKVVVETPKKIYWTAEEAKTETEDNVLRNTLVALDKVNTAVEANVKEGICYLDLYHMIGNHFRCYYAQKIIDKEYFEAVLRARGFDIRESSDMDERGTFYLVWGEVEL